MNKFLTKLILTTTVATAVATCLAGCGDGIITPQANDNNSDDKTANIINIESPLKYGTRYINHDDVAKPTTQQNYYIFENNGTAKFHRYSIFDYFESTEISSYTIKLKYTFLNAGKTRVTCFYDSIEYDTVDSQKKKPTLFCTTLDVSENVLLGMGQSGYYEYISENYLPQIPNYGVTTD